VESIFTKIMRSNRPLHQDEGGRVSSQKALFLERETEKNDKKITDFKKFGYFCSPKQKVLFDYWIWEWRLARHAITKK
jgi:hypothetical protein